MNRGDEAVALNKMNEALKEYSKAQAMVPDNDEFVFWTAVTLVSNARMPEAIPLFSKAFRMNPSWMLLIPRLIAAGQLPDRPGLAEAILASGPKAELSPK
jgi:tetratricopeptide (TPR) repeat protein